MTYIFFLHLLRIALLRSIFGIQSSLNMGHLFDKFPANFELELINRIQFFKKKTFMLCPQRNKMQTQGVVDDNYFIISCVGGD